MVSLTSFGIVKSAVTTLFICLISPETRNIFETNHPNDYNKLSNNGKNTFHVNMTPDNELICMAFENKVDSWIKHKGMEWCFKENDFFI